MRQCIASGIFRKSIPDFRATNSAEYLTLLNQNLGVFEENYLKNLLTIYNSFISIFIAVILLIYINPLIAIISIIAKSIPSLLPKIFTKKLGLQQSQIMQTTTSYNASIKDILNGFEVIKSYQVTDTMEHKNLLVATELEKQKQNMADTMALVYGLANLASITVQFLLMTLSGIFAVQGWISLGNIIAVTQLSGQAIAPAFQLSAQFNQYKSTKPICQQILAVINEPVNSNRLLPFKEMNSSLKMRDVTFSYEDTPVFKNINLVFEAGKKYAIVGKSYILPFAWRDLKKLLKIWKMVSIRRSKKTVPAFPATRNSALPSQEPCSTIRIFFC